MTDGNETLQGDRMKVLAAVNQDGCALQYTSMELQDSTDFRTSYEKRPIKKLKNKLIKPK